MNLISVFRFRGLVSSVGGPADMPRPDKRRWSFSLLIISESERIHALTMNEAEDTESWCQQQTLIQILCHKTSKYTSQKNEVLHHRLTWAQNNNNNNNITWSRNMQCVALRRKYIQTPAQVTNMAAVQCFTWHLKGSATFFYESHLWITCSRTDTVKVRLY